VVSGGDNFWADLGVPAGRRPVCVITRDTAISVLSAVTCAPLTRTIRAIASEVDVGPTEGLPERCVISCDNLVTLPKAVLDERPVGMLGPQKLEELDVSLRSALDIQH